jgi:hypothetical protein
MDGGKRMLKFLLIVGMCGTVKGFDKELEKGSIMGFTNTGTMIYIEWRTDFLHTKISLKQTVVGLMKLDDWITSFHDNRKSNLDSTLANSLRKRYNNMVVKLESIVGGKGEREKRSLEFIGNLWSDLFGNPVPEDWKQNNTNILALRQAIELEGKDSNVVHKHIDKNEHDIERLNLELIKLASEYGDEKNKLGSQLAMMENYFQLNDACNTLDKLLDK